MVQLKACRNNPAIDLWIHKNIMISCLKTQKLIPTIVEARSIKLYFDGRYKKQRERAHT